MMDGMDIEPSSEIARAFWHHNFHMYDDSEPSDLLVYFALMSWGDVNDRKVLEETVSQMQILFHYKEGTIYSYSQA